MHTHANRQTDIKPRFTFFVFCFVGIMSSSATTVPTQLPSKGRPPAATKRPPPSMEVVSSAKDNTAKGGLQGTVGSLSMEVVCSAKDTSVPPLATTATTATTTTTATAAMSFVSSEKDNLVKGGSQRGTVGSLGKESASEESSVQGQGQGRGEESMSMQEIKQQLVMYIRDWTRCKTLLAETLAQKKQLEKQILNIMTPHKLERLDITGGHIQKFTTKTKKPLTKATLQANVREFVHINSQLSLTEQDVDNMVAFVLEHREIVVREGLQKKTAESKEQPTIS